MKEKKSENSASYPRISAQARLETAKAIQAPQACLYNVYHEIIANVAAKVQRSNQKVNCFSSEKYQIHPLKKWLKNGRQSLLHCVFKNGFPKFLPITEVLLPSWFILPLLSHPPRHSCPAKQLLGPCVFLSA